MASSGWPPVLKKATERAGRWPILHASPTEPCDGANPFPGLGLCARPVARPWYAAPVWQRQSEGDQMRHVDRVLETALEYVRQEVPVTAAHGVVRGASDRRFRRGRWKCDCGVEACLRPGSHPIEGGLSLSGEWEVINFWRQHPSANLMISPGGGIDIWDVPREIGALAMRRMEEQQLAAWPPVLRRPNGRWVFCTSPLTHSTPPGIAAHGTMVRRFAGDELLLVPPSQTPLGRPYWEWASSFPWTPIADPGPLLAALASAAAGLHSWEVSR